MARCIRFDVVYSFQSPSYFIFVERITLPVCNNALGPGRIDITNIVRGVIIAFNRATSPVIIVRSEDYDVSLNYHQSRHSSDIIKL